MVSEKLKGLAATALLGAVLISGFGIASAANTTVVVTADDLETAQPPIAFTSDKWLFYDDNTNTTNNMLGSFVMGPGNPPEGAGSAQISTIGTGRPNLATFRFKDTPLSEITVLRYSTYNPSAGNGGSSQRSGYLQFNVSFDGTDTWQRRLVYVPATNATVVQDTWKEWDAIDGGAARWRHSGPVWPGTTISGSTTRTWADIISSYPNARLRSTDSFMGIRVGEPYADGYTENIDSFKFGTAAGTTTFDFEPYHVATDKEQCKNGGWMTLRRADGSSFNNQGDCIQYVNNGQ